MAEKPRIRLPSSVKKGEVFQVKTLLKHPMESGNRKDESGKALPRKIINKFVCKANGKEVFASDFYTSVSADPFLTFHLKLEETSKLQFEWYDDDGSVISETVEVKVE
ncbi:thiosulfate oxidation carrier complex protein SoxZ [Pinisolibacter sp.]|uniref:thiosulfate oxidation carrier complex protein SoxZ n=1 Tax=Pinisolibacter sp. TaxID=2172024 RepID=UPI002FDE8C6B